MNYLQESNHVNPVVRQVVALQTPWATIDPFLFCVHHRDAYPAGNGAYGPAASLAGRSIGNDFANVDGWNMYHGDSVPGFPQHPHRGFETLTYVRRGLVDHADSAGAVARYGKGDAQWMTAGSGIVHSEMFPLLDTEADNPMELFQIWINLAAADKMVEPHFSMLWAHDIPVIAEVDQQGRRTRVTLVAGMVGEHRPPAPPPSSWAARPDSDVAIWHIVLDDGASWTMPAANFDDTIRTVYLFDGDAVAVGSEAISGYSGAVLDASRAVELVATDGPVELLVLQGRPIGEPVERYGPFVMNTRAEIAKPLMTTGPLSSAVGHGRATARSMAPTGAGSFDGPMAPSRSTRQQLLLGEGVRQAGSGEVARHLARRGVQVQRGLEDGVERGQHCAEQHDADDGDHDTQHDHHRDTRGYEEADDHHERDGGHKPKQS